VKKTKNVFYLLIVVALFSGCAKPVMVTDGVHRRAFIPCEKDELCIRNTYGISRDYYCSDFPVAYRNNDSEYNAKRYEWIYQPKEIVQK